VSFSIIGTLHGRTVSVEWLEGPDPPWLRLRGDPELVADVRELVAQGAEVAATPTGPTFTAALDPDYVALVTICAALDADAMTRADGEVPEVPGIDIPPGAVA
jgi:hypothetical protein